MDEQFGKIEPTQSAYLNIVSALWDFNFDVWSQEIYTV
jgi:hypothetical protein